LTLKNNFTAIKNIAWQLFFFVVYVAKNFRVFYLVLGLTFVVLAFEYLAVSLMIPLASSATNIDSVAIKFWSWVAEALDLGSNARVWLWLFLLLLMGRVASGYLLLLLNAWLGKRVHERLSEEIFGHILSIEPLVQVYNRTVGHYITIAGDDTFRAGTIISSLLQSAVAFFTAVVGMLVLYQFSPIIFFISILFLLLAGVLIALIMRLALRSNVNAVYLSKSLGTTLVEALNGLRSIRSLHCERFVAATYSKQIHTYVRVLLRIEALKQGAKVLPALILLLLVAYVLRPENADISMSDASIFTCTLIVLRVFVSLGQLVAAGSQVLTEMRAVTDILAMVQLYDTSPEELSANAAEPVRVIELSNISFAYARRGPIFSEINFRFDAGSTYAIMGSSGSGKSTLADLMLGLIEPSRGRIRINESKLSAASACKKFALVEQQPKIFSSTIRENLLLGQTTDDEHVHSALRLVNLECLVRSLPQGLDTKLSYLGENFSGGQRQRLGIARALLRRPEVLILDEATSALDPQTRADVVKNICEYMKDGILIFITHDPEVAMLADEILHIRAEAAI
jgi:ABC-type bacteriocin/lantibiotic exporter with double-glycine peptidase domain